MLATQTHHQQQQYQQQQQQQQQQQHSQTYQPHPGGISYHETLESTYISEQFPGVSNSPSGQSPSGQSPSGQSSAQNLFESLPEGSSTSYSRMAAAGVTDKPYVEILIQPKQRGFRFRYECEGRSAGSIPGEDSTNENRTFPTIKVHNTNGSDSIVVVSCVTKDNPARPHPHSLVGKDCQKGVCTVRLKKTNIATFTNLGVQCAKKREVPKALEERKNIRVDPFGTGFNFDHNNIDLTTVRLCFQVFLPDSSGKFTQIVKPAVSQPVFDRKSVLDLAICRISRQAGSVAGGDEVFLLCEKVNKDDIEIRFFQSGPEGLIWEARGEFSPQDVHRQVAIVFRTPPFRDRSIKKPMTVHIQLKRPSDNVMSEHLDFQYIPEDRDPDGIDNKRKRKKLYFEHMTDAASDMSSYAGGMLPIRGQVKNEPQDSKSLLRRKLLHQKDPQQPQGLGMSGGGFLPQGVASTGTGTMPNYTFTNMQQPAAMLSGNPIGNLPGSRPGDGIMDPDSATLNQLVGDQMQGASAMPGGATAMSIAMDESAQQLLSTLSDGGIASNTSDLLRMLAEGGDMQMGDSTDLEKLLAGTDGLLDFSSTDMNAQGIPK